MDQYYYTVSSLPYLSMETKPELTIEQFLKQCSAEVSEGKMRILTNVTLVPSPVHNTLPGIVKKWFAFAASFSNQLIQGRAKNLNRSAQKYLRPGDEVFEAQLSARQLMNIENPLEAELQQIRSLYQFLDDQQVGHFFDFHFLIIYKLKLELLLRKFSFTQERGQENFNQIDEHFSSIISSGGIHE
ncbi:MAG: hypothetical protein JXR70_08195 [Spirochaetales bacterium]|nr:hypothetical protein [Spirochaetales bacterium]